MLKSEIKTPYGAIVLTLAAIFAGGLVWVQSRLIEYPEPQIVVAMKKARKPMAVSRIERPKPAPVSMERLKTQGCVTDGLLSEYNPETENFIALINRSNCYYMHRAIETWLKPPDFQTIDFEMSQITKKDVVYGMFIAEAISTKADYYYSDDYQKKFDFKAMCREGTENAWGEHSCKPDFSKKEYREYLEYTTHKAIDLGVQSFTFGQIYWQEWSGVNYTKKIIKDMRDYAKKTGIDIVIGAQTGDNTDPEYLALFDYIEGGVGLHADGSVEEGPCYDHRGGCWALLWNKTFSSKAKNVLLHLDWTGIKSDDLDTFARMDQEERARTLQDLYLKFTSQNMGFLMPYFGVLDTENGGCHGPKKRFYSPDKAYSCKDEKIISDILSGKNKSSQLSERDEPNKSL